MPPRTRKPSVPSYTVPGLKLDTAGEAIALLQDRLNALNDLALTLKHVHWNVVGSHFIAVHTMLDPQVDAVRVMVDDLAERIATLGGSPVGTPGALVAQRTWDGARAYPGEVCDVAISRQSGVEHAAPVEDAEVCVVLRDLKRRRRGEERLFAYWNPSAKSWHAVHADEINEYLKASR